MSRASGGLPERRHPFRYDDATYREINRPMLVTVCTKERRPTLTGEAARIVAEVLLDRASRFGVVVYAYCVMPDHLHFLGSVRRSVGDLGKLMRNLKAESARRINAELRLTGEGGFRWQRSYWDRFSRREEDTRAQIEYMLANPVRKGLCESAEQWPHSAVLQWP